MSDPKITIGLNHTFEIDLTPEVRNELIDVMKADGVEEGTQADHKDIYDAIVGIIHDGLLSTIVGGDLNDILSPAAFLIHVPEDLTIDIPDGEPDDNIND